MGIKTNKGGMSLALGDLLVAEEPVWVWDVGARKILWANRAGQVFWGADTLESLRARRFDARNKTINHIATLAKRGGRSREWTERLTFPGRPDRSTVTCYMQSLEVAGGRLGLIVKALGAAVKPGPPVAAPANATEAGTAAKSALKAIAAQIEQARASRQELRDGAAVEAGAASSTAASLTSPSPQHAALIRELCHELRNPLTVIIGFAECIRDADPVRSRSKAQGYAENILEGAHLALDILRDFSGRLTAGAVAPAPEPANVKAAVESCLGLVAPLAKQAGLTLSKSLGRRLPDLKVETRALKQMLLNVLLNAVRHQKIGGRISVRARRGRDGVLRIAISDDGIGMTKKEIKAALSGKPRQTAEAGSFSGLGLPLVKRLAESGGGTIAIESARRKGTHVEIRFPPASLLKRG
jgi:signal transduction histidine kinase